MVKKGRGKGKVKNKLVEDKKKELQKLWDFFLVECNEYERHANRISIDACDRIHKIYADKLTSLPENVRNMTLSEYMAMQIDTQPKEVTQDLLKGEYEKSKLMSEKKKTLKKAKLEKKKSLSASVMNLSSISSHPALLSRASRVLSESCLSTPLSKRSVAPTFAVTPKFNPRVPINKSHLRRARAGEVLMSLSGSPIQNFIEDIPEKPGYAISLGGGKFIKITEDTELSKLENDFSAKMDQDTKATLANVKKKLDKILKG